MWQKWPRASSKTRCHVALLSRNPAIPWGQSWASLLEGEMSHEEEPTGERWANLDQPTPSQPTSGQLTYEPTLSRSGEPFQVSTTALRTYRHVKNNKWFPFKPPSLGMVYYLTTANWYKHLHFNSFQDIQPHLIVFTQINHNYKNPRLGEFGEEKKIGTFICC